ncbi:hypothetical protein Fmac_000788 [Flemingia macrophylla]|uniref:Gigantea n=1 Tax=Flemingia macrophylla TaxID=520843 RepID=A0ABD1NGV0_9FABA
MEPPYLEFNSAESLELWKMRENKTMSVAHDGLIVALVVQLWVFHFAHLRQLPVLIPYMPTENPRLRDTAYEIALVALATNSSFHKDLSSAVKSWPPVCYSALPVISANEPQLILRP